MENLGFHLDDKKLRRAGLDYQELTTVTEHHSYQAMLDKFNSKEDFVLLDVRENDEFSFANIGGKHIPLPELQERVDELDSDKAIIVMCHHGIRSAQAARYLESQGFKNVFNLNRHSTELIYT